MCSKIIVKCVLVILAAAFLAFASSSASAANVTLFAGTKIITMPDGQNVTMWGFGLAPGSIEIPGPQITITPGDTTLTINLTNNLPEPISLIINGQKETSMTPVWTDGASVYTGSRPAGNYSARVRSFTHEAASNGGTASYTWNNLKPGTYLYTSGTNPAVQIQMGLYGALKVDAATKNVYNHPATAYDQDVVMLFSEVDPVIHAAVENNTYGPVPGATVTSMVHYTPRYFLINGKAYPGLQPIAAGTTNTKTLIRFLNAGGKTHAPALLGGLYMTLLAEDGNLYPYLTRQQCSLELPAGKTIDVMITNPGAAGNIPLYDRALNLTNAGLTTPGVYPGGMLAFLHVTPSNLTASIRALVREYYLDILDREPDQAGWDYWTNEILRIMNLGIYVGEGFQAEARLFFNSLEYLNKNTTDTEFVTDLYQAFLQREPDAGGLAFWVGELNCLTRDMLITQFAYSAEFQAYLSNQFGADTTRPENNMVNDFYRGILGRLPDDGGFNAWLQQMRLAQCSGAQAVKDLSYQISLLFVQSQEYTNRNRNNTQYIEDLYNAILRRGGDCAGFQAWITVLNGGMPREQVLQFFTNSTEFQTRVDAVIAAGCL